MIIENIIELSAVIVAVFLLIIKRKGMKKYVPVAFFAMYWAVAWCAFSKYFHWWDYPHRNFPYFNLSATVDFIIVPIIAMFWVRYAPNNFKGLLSWALLSAAILVCVEYALERYTDLLEYGEGYGWLYSFVLWFISLFAWYGFHIWFYKGKKGRIWSYKPAMNKNYSMRNNSPIHS